MKTNALTVEREVKALRDRNIELLGNHKVAMIKKDYYIHRWYSQTVDTDIFMRVCVMELLSHSVEIRQVEPVIEAVLKLV